MFARLKISAALAALAFSLPAAAVGPVSLYDQTVDPPKAIGVPGNGLVVRPDGAASSDISGTVTTGGTYQTVLASNTLRKGCLIQNPSTATEILSIKVGTMATAYQVPAGASFSCASAAGLVATDAITLTAATTAHAFAGTAQ